MDCDRILPPDFNANTDRYIDGVSDALRPVEALLNDWAELGDNPIAGANPTADELAALRRRLSDCAATLRDFEREQHQRDHGDWVSNSRTCAF